MTRDEYMDLDASLQELHGEYEAESDPIYMGYQQILNLLDFNHNTRCIAVNKDYDAKRDALEEDYRISKEAITAALNFSLVPLQRRLKVRCAFAKTEHEAGAAETKHMIDDE